MYFGILNKPENKIEYEIVRCNTNDAPQIRETGNPFKGERLRIRFTEFTGTNLKMRVRLDKEFFVNRVNIHLCDKCDPFAVIACSEDGKPFFTYHSETGKTISEKNISLPIDEKVTGFSIEFVLDYSSLIIDNIEIYGADLTELQPYPFPASFRKTGEPVSIATFDSFSCDSPEGRAGAKVLSEKLAEKTGILLSEKENGVIRFVKAPSVKAGGYNLTVTCNGALIEASDLRGSVYGAEVLLKLIENGKIQQVTISDSPAFEFRGIHILLPSTKEMEFTKRLIKYVISPMGYNYVIIEIAGAMRFDSHPEINAAVEDAVIKGLNGIWPSFPHRAAGDGKTVEKRDIAELVDYIRSYGIDVIPEVQSLGHVQFMTLAHPEIAELSSESKKHEETDMRLADVPPSDFYAHSFCPSNPDSYKLLFDLLDEIIEVMRPTKYVHMGHDEVYQIGICDKCKSVSPAKLFADDVNRIYRYLASKNLKMMIWSDMLQPVSPYKTVDAIDMLPKDIVMLDFIWYFHPDKDIEDNILSKGYKVILGNMYSSHYPRYENRIRKAGVIGAQVSTWVITREEELAIEGKMYDLVYSAQMLWSENYSEHLRYSYDKVVSGLLPGIKAELENKPLPSGEGNRTVLYESDKAPEVDEMAKSVSVSGIGQCMDSIVFSHTASAYVFRQPWGALEKLAYYKIIYEDGGEERIDIEYGKSIGFWNRRHNEPLKSFYFRHTGYPCTYYTGGEELRNRKGEITTFYEYEWENPRKNVPVSAIELIQLPESKADILVKSIIQLNRKAAS